MSNRDRLRELLLDVFLLDPGQFRFDLTRDEVDSWDSLGTVSLAVGIQEVFGHHLSPQEATRLASVEDIMAALRAKGVDFGDA
ncbi:MAG: acyl carrier protein [Acidobacteriota bacterium]